MPPPNGALIKKLSAFGILSPDETARLDAIQSKPFIVRRGRELFHEGQNGPMLFIVLCGWACSHKDLPDGRRQITHFSIPGDCVGLRNVYLNVFDHTLSALTEATFCTIDAARLMQLFDEFPRIRAGLLWSAARDEAMALERLVGIGRRTAAGRIAHFFLELAERLALVGLATGNEFKCPLNQYVLADALGLSAIHVNRVLRVLRELGFLSIKSGIVTIHNAQSLGHVADGHSLNHRSETLIKRFSRSEIAHDPSDQPTSDAGNLTQS